MIAGFRELPASQLAELLQADSRPSCLPVWPQTESVGVVVVLLPAATTTALAAFPSNEDEMDNLVISYQTDPRVPSGRLLVFIVGLSLWKRLADD